MSARGEPRGVKTRIIGVILIFVAMMNAMLHWRGGFDLGTGSILFFAAGISFYAIGAVIARIGIDRAHDQSRESALQFQARADSPGWRIAEGDSTQPGSGLGGRNRQRITETDQ